MNPPRSEGFVRMPDAEFEAILTRAAEEGAKRALADVGLDGDEAALDIRDLRSLVDCIRLGNGSDGNKDIDLRHHFARIRNYLNHFAPSINARRTNSSDTISFSSRTSSILGSP